MIVVAASVLANVVGDDRRDGQRSRAAVRAAGDLSAPDLIDVEVVAVLHKRWLAKQLDDARFAAAVDDLTALPLRLSHGSSSQGCEPPGNSGRSGHRMHDRPEPAAHARQGAPR